MRNQLNKEFEENEKDNDGQNGTRKKETPMKPDRKMRRKTQPDMLAPNTEAHDDSSNESKNDNIMRKRIPSLSGPPFISKAVQKNQSKREVNSKSYHDHDYLDAKQSEKLLDNADHGTWLLRKNKKDEYRITVKQVLKGL